ncbi:hypothetical protein J7L13_03285 [bacterium]|nr:hypothetical protein [bacterium]
MAKTPYFLIKQVSLTANGTGVIEIRTDANETLYLDKIAFSSTGNFEIFDWEDSRGNSFTNATTDNTIDNDLIPVETAHINYYIDLREPIVIEPASVHTISVKDLSGAANTVKFFAIGVRELK